MIWDASVGQVDRPTVIIPTIAEVFTKHNLLCFPSRQDHNQWHAKGGQGQLAQVTQFGR